MCGEIALELRDSRTWIGNCGAAVHFAQINVGRE